MTIEYTKTKQAETAFFLLFGGEGTWQEVSEDSYRSAMVASGIKGVTPVEFKVDAITGTFTQDGSVPENVKKTFVASPMLRRSSEAPDASYRLVFPSGSYSVASVDENSSMVTVVLTPEQYQRLAKVQMPHAIEKIAAKLEEKAEGAGAVKESLLGGLAEALHQIADDLRKGTPVKKNKRPTLQDLRGLLKG